MTKENKLLDLFKYAAAIFVVASHCLPLVDNIHFNFFYGQWFFRFCVPFFVISSGSFFLLSVFTGLVHNPLAFYVLSFLHPLQDV